MTMTAILILFTILGLVAVGTILVGLPGTWILLLLAVIVEVIDGKLFGGTPTTFGWWAIGGGFALAIVGEGLDLLAGALGAKQGGATRRGTIGAFLGGLVGALVGTFFIPVPVFGTLLGALAGTFGGALYGEMTHPELKKTADEAMKPAIAATIGRVLGTVGKTGIGVVVWLTLVIVAFVL